MAGSLKRLFQNLLLGLAGSLERISPSTPSVPRPVEDEYQNLERSLHDYSARKWKRGQIRVTYSGPMLSLDEGGVLSRTRTWKTVTDRDLRNRCTEGTGITEDDTV